MLIKAPHLAIASVLAAAVLGAVGQFLIEYGARHVKGGVIGFLTNPYILTGMSGYLLVMVLFTYAFRTGGTVRVLYPLYASTFIWAALIAWIAYHQPVQPVHAVGMILLITGMICMSW
jgi:multidrug transporter EmrE-like cation transporter